MGLAPERIKVGHTVMVVKPLFTETKIKARVGQMAAEISNAHGSHETLVVLVVLHGALLFAADLVRGLTMPTEIESVRLKSYKGTESTGTVQLEGAIPNLEGKHVLVVEDIVDSGRSIAFLKNHLAQSGAKSIKIAALLDKPDAHGADTAPDYTGFAIGRNFVIGYGLDLDGRFRNLPFVAELIGV
jgi:hypoxanthine phosphoribosyltransferase